MKRIEAAAEARLDYIDNLRWVMIALVVGLHAAVTYSHIGSWYYNAPERPGPGLAAAFLVFEFHLQGFFMGFLFLLAGYFVPAAYDRKGFRRFLTDRWLRLGVPSLAYMLVIHPLTGYFLLHCCEGGFPAAYGHFLTSGDWLRATGTMWFAVALLFFSAVYAGCRLVSGGGAGAAAVSQPSLLWLILLGLTIAVVAFVVRIDWPIGTNFFNMQFCYFTQYVVLFAVGIQAYRRAWFRTLPRHLGLRLFWGALILSPLAGAILVAPQADPLGWVMPIGGKGSWQSAVFALWESLYCVAMCAGLLVLFRDGLNGTNGWFRRFTASSFGVYMMHMPVLVAVTLALADTGLPSLARFAISWPAALVLTFLLVEFGLRRIPGVRRFL